MTRRAIGEQNGVDQLHNPHQFSLPQNSVEKDGVLTTLPREDINNPEKKIEASIGTF